MTEREAAGRVRAAIKEQRTRYVPNEHRGDSSGQLGFDYGYQQALIEMDAQLYLVFPKQYSLPGNTPAEALTITTDAAGYVTSIEDSHA